MMRKVLTGWMFIPLFASPLAGQAQEPEVCGPSPSDVVIMLDRTLSVSPEDRQLEGEAAVKLTALLLENPGNRVSIGRFGAGDCESSYQNYLRLRDWVDAEILQPLQDDMETLNESITQNMRDASCGGTDLNDAIETASAELSTGENPERAIILISDGDPNQPPDDLNARLKAMAAAETAKAGGIRIFTIAFDASTETDLENRRRLAAMASHDSRDDTQGEVAPVEQESENTDGDDFFIAPGGEHLEKVFRTIGEAILCPPAEEPAEKVVPTEIPQEAAAEETTPPSPILFLHGGGCSLNGNLQHPTAGWRILAALLMFSLPGLTYPRLRPSRLP